MPQTAEHNNARHRFDYEVDQDKALMPRVGGPNVLLEGLRFEDHDPMRVTA